LQSRFASAPLGVVRSSLGEQELALPARQALTDAVAGYPGTVNPVTHDRYLLGREEPAGAGSQPRLPRLFRRRLDPLLKLPVTRP